MKTDAFYMPLPIRFPSERAAAEITGVGLFGVRIVFLDVFNAVGPSSEPGFTDSALVNARGG